MHALILTMRTILAHSTLSKEDADAVLDAFEHMNPRDQILFHALMREDQSRLSFAAQFLKDRAAGAAPRTFSESERYLLAAGNPA